MVLFSQCSSGCGERWLLFLGPRTNFEDFVCIFVFVPKFTSLSNKNSTEMKANDRTQSTPKRLINQESIQNAHKLDVQFRRNAQRTVCGALCKQNNVFFFGNGRKTLYFIRQKTHDIKVNPKRRCSEHQKTYKGFRRDAYIKGIYISSASLILRLRRQYVVTWKQQTT